MSEKHRGARDPQPGAPDAFCARIPVSISRRLPPRAAPPPLALLPGGAPRWYHFRVRTVFVRQTIHRALIALCLVATASGRAVPPQQTFAVTQSFTLRQAPNGVSGTLELLMDSRLTASIREEMWGQGDWSIVFPPESSIFKEFSALPPGSARIEIRDNSGKLLATRALDVPLAKIEEWSPVGKTNWGYLLTQDYSTGMGSYSGPGTTLIQISGAAIHDASALDAKTHQEEPIRLAKTLKQDWKIMTGGNGTEILTVSCHPKSAEDDSFVVEYMRYAFEGTRWLKYSRQETGFWESDHPFPPRSAFP